MNNTTIEPTTSELISALQAEIKELETTLAALDGEDHAARLGAQLDTSKAPKGSLLAQIKDEEKRLIASSDVSAALQERTRMIASAISLLQGKRDQLNTLNLLLKQEQLEEAAESEREQIQALVEKFNSLSTQATEVAIALWNLDRTAIKELGSATQVMMRCSDG